MDQHTTNFNAMLAEAERILNGDLTNEQVVVVKTAMDQTYHCINRSMGHRIGYEFDMTDEENLIKTLRDNNDTEVQFLVALWNPCVVEGNTQNSLPLEIPSWHLRQRLLELHPNNQNTLVLLAGDRDVTVKKLGDFMPANGKIL